MTTDATVVVERPAAHTAIVRIDRPERLNALDYETVDAIHGALLDLGADDSCRAIVLTGSGRAFCAGMDIGNAVRRDGERSVGPIERLTNQERFAGMVRAIRTIRQPVIAAVNGPAAGAGFGLALAADIRIAATSARFHVAAVKIGLSGGECGISYHLPRHVGSARAFEILLTGRPFDAAEADRIGLVTRVVPDGELLDAALELAAAIAENSPFAVWMTKKVMWQNLDATFDAALELENRTQILAVMTADAREAMHAFVEKRPPTFEGE